MAGENKQNLQDAFLNHVRKQKIPVTVFLVNGVKRTATAFSNVDTSITCPGTFDRSISMIGFAGRVPPCVAKNSADSRLRVADVQGSRECFVPATCCVGVVRCDGFGF